MTALPVVVALDWTPLRKRRRLLNVTQREAGAFCGVTASTVCRWEKGTRQVSALELAQLARGLGTPGFDLFRTIEEGKPT
jgi:transcriptional regulator with XRE-family HTH domain